ncbi:MAG: N-acetyltransferase [Bacteroides sp.]|nr:N-acetyltransferase [Bacteroides sp.]
MVTIKALEPVKKEIKKYVNFGIDLYKDNDYFVPNLIFDEVHTLLPEKNPAFEYCRAQSFMAYRDGRPAGRITAIINDRLNESTGRKQARFGFVDFIDDNEVVDALFATAEEWARDRGMTEIIGPMGFTDMDREGMLVDGFNEMGTMATIYNFDYYPRQVERLGYRKDTDWVEFRIKVPEKVPEKMARIAEIVMKKYNLRILKYTSAKKIKEEYGHALFHLINETYADLYGYCTLSERQIDYYIDMYLSILRLEYVSVVVDENNELVGVGISIPSLSKALRKCGGRLFPTGWYHILKAMKSSNEVIDLLLIAVKPKYQSKGVNSLFFYDLIDIYNANGIKYAESNLELESNSQVQSQWAYFDKRQHRRRRAYRKEL